MKKSVEHSPAPWELRADGRTIAVAGSRPSAGSIAKVSRSTGRSDEVDRANGLLMAASPQMLAALRRLAFAAASRENTMGDPCTLIDCQRELREATEQAREAIAKATQP